MARGWESKAVAEQMDEQDKLVQQPTDYDVSPDVRARREQLESLKLSRARTLEQLERARLPAHRAMLERALGALDAKIEEAS
ncbi:MAG: hypothetical protein H0V27_05025 [Pyrinomonadaceae bacterium]|jgi:hypothetical protein|nr:hypothetical protein [Pyrinomonadaceae bacterium]